jgi:hypothetical protein
VPLSPSGKLLSYPSKMCGPLSKRMGSPVHTVVSDEVCVRVRACVKVGE